MHTREHMELRSCVISSARRDCIVDRRAFTHRKHGAVCSVYHKFRGPIQVEDIPVPVAPDGGVVVEVRATGVCRSDWHGWSGHDSDIEDHGMPFVPGHEVSGVVASVGAGVTTFAVGDRVAIPFILSCGCCRECLRSKPTVCEDQQQPVREESN